MLMIDKTNVKVFMAFPSFSFLITLQSHKSASVIATMFIKTKININTDPRPIINDNTSNTSIEPEGVKVGRRPTIVYVDIVIISGMANKINIKTFKPNVTES